MQIRREEIRTGLLVVASITILTGVLLAIGMPGVFKATNTFNIYFDNAAGLNQGAPVLLAGRRIGQVINLISPVPVRDRPKPETKPAAQMTVGTSGTAAPAATPPVNYETLVQVEVDRSAKIYQKVEVHMVQTSLLGAPVIDFTNGDENSGLASNGSYFVGVRQKDFTTAIADAVDVIQSTITPVAVQAQKTMQELSATADNLRQLTAPGSNVDQTVTQFREFGDNLVRISAKDGTLEQSLDNVQTLTGSNGHLNHALTNLDQLTNDLVRQDRIGKTLTNLESTSESLNGVVGSLAPRVDIITANLQEATDTLKKQPWRLVWPSTKKYPSPTPRPTPTRRR